ncbi:hypothetical protein LHJ74_22760 [Streptomyces sp. N2-109]|uniref:WD40 repeat domain-containing protein n=1 Tax=Streptomyces gossypii TaxID=2883101 RepID=A0ABT2JYE0_9ACTN|nr:hypothetical protein [Streptomyces gossypii]MCT2592698.1 hypothetical protein [Streptomyces gossypii]
MRALCTRLSGGSANSAAAGDGSARAAAPRPGPPRPSRARRAVTLAVSAACAAVGVLFATVPAATAGSSTRVNADDPSAFNIKDPRITESSGLAASRAHPGVYWTHNDSEDGPYVYAVDSRTGETVATVTLQGVEPRDVEGISLGPGGELFVGDIGDNLGGSWSEVWIYRFAEPEKLRDTTVTPTRYTVQYADGPRDAESLMVHPKTGRVYIASKNDEKKGGVYAGPEKLSAMGVNTFQRVGRTDMWATDGAFSPDGTRLLLRSYFGAEMYRWTADGRPEPIDTVNVPMQRQGESVTFTPDGRTLMFGTEGEGGGVEPEDLEGELLPERAAKEKAAEEKDGGSGGDGEGNTAEENRELLVGGATFALAVGVWMAVRRLFRRRS